MSAPTMKTCSLCGEAKPVAAFYAGSGTHGVSTYCKKCDNARPRKKTSALKINRMRARHRAVADLIDMHPEDFEALYAIRMAEAADEAEELAEVAAKEHPEVAANNEPIRLKPGKRMAGEKAGDRIDVARCPHCIKHHDRGHVCASCGADPATSRAESTRSVSHDAQVKRTRNQNLVSSSLRPAPSGVRPRTSIDAAALAEFNAGTERARRAAR